MAEQQQINSQSAPQTETEAPVRSWKPRPLAILLLSLLLWVFAAVTAVAANIGMHYLEPFLAQQQLPIEDYPAWIAATYLIYAPATLLALLGLATLITAGVRWGIYGRRHTGVPTDLDEQRLLRLLESLNQRATLTETTKRLAHRHYDLQALRQAITNDIDQGNYDPALALVTELALTYGYREEAEDFRERINAERAAHQDARIRESIAKLDEILARHEFDRAFREAAKIQRLYPDSERAQNLQRRVDEAREQYKRELEREFLEAAHNDNVDHAMQILKTLDHYLTEEEAAPLRETARGVIGKQRDNLGVQFKLAVRDKNWTRAVHIGEQIIRDFPNTRMADEVRSMIDPIRQRAASEQAVHA